MPEAAVEPMAEAAEAALAKGRRRAADVGYLEAHAGGTAGQDRAELDALARVYPAGSGSTALGSAKAQIGDTGCAAAMAGLIRAVLCLHHSYLPGAPGWRPGRRTRRLLRRVGALCAENSRPWLRARGTDRRYAAVAVIGADGAHGHLVLSADATRGRTVTADWRRAGGPVLLPLSAATADGLLDAVEEHRRLLAEGADPGALARKAAAALPGGVLRAVLVGADGAELAHQLELAARGLPAAHARGEEWATPAGSFSTGSPIGPAGKVALVYPGAFNSYPASGATSSGPSPGCSTVSRRAPTNRPGCCASACCTPARRPPGDGAS